MTLVARVLGQSSFGELGLIQATVGVAGLLAGVGVGETATRFVAQHVNVDPPRAGRVVGMVNLSSWLSILLISIFIVAASPYIAREVLSAPHLQDAVAYSVLLVIAASLRGVQNGILAGFEQFDTIAKLSVVEGVVSLIVVLVLANLIGIEGAILGLAIGSAAAWGVGRACLTALLRRSLICVSYRESWCEWRMLVHYSCPNLAANLVATPALWFSMTLLTKIPNGYEDMGIYHAAYQWHGPVVFIPIVITAVSIPVLVQEWEGGRQQQFRKVILGMCGLTLLLTLPLIIVLAMLSPWIMGLYGPDFRHGWPILVLLLLAAPLHALSKMGASALFSMRRVWSVLGVNSIWSLTLLTLALWLVPVHGALGLAVAFCAAYSLLAVLTWALLSFGSKGLLRLPEMSPRDAL